MGISLDGSTISGVVVGNTVVNTVSGLVFYECSAIVKNNISLLNTTRDVWLSNALPDFKFSDNRFSTLTNTNANVVTPNFSNGDTTPSVIGRGWYKTANTNSTTYTALDDGVDGQVVTILFADGNSHVDFTGTTLRGNGGVDWDPGSGDHMTCTRISGIWYCVVSDN